MAKEQNAVDFSVLARICDTSDAEGTALARQLLGMFLEKTPRRLTEMSEAAAQGDLKPVKHAAHQLKSTSANIGARRFRELCVAIENNTDAALVTELLDKLKEEYQLVQRELVSELERNR